MKKIVFLLATVSILLAGHLSSACIGRTVHLGLATAHNERLLAEMASLLISERTGTTVQIDVFKDSTELYNAVRQGKVNVFFETPARAAEIVGKAKDTPFEQIRSSYRTKLNLTWLDPGPAQYAPVLTTETLVTYPALPKLLNKLSRALESTAYAKMVKAVEAGDQAKKVAKEFLKGKKMI